MYRTFDLFYFIVNLPSLCMSIVDQNITLNSFNGISACILSSVRLAVLEGKTKSDCIKSAEIFPPTPPQKKTKEKYISSRPPMIFFLKIRPA